MNYFTSNLKFLRKQKGLTQGELANKIGVNRPKIGSYEEGRAEPKFETLQNISHFFQITLDDLLEKKLSHSEELLIKNSGENHLRILPILVNSDNEELIPLVPVKAAAGYMNNYDDVEFVENLPKFSLPVKELSQGTYRAFQIKGDSMLPIPSNTYILSEYVENWNWIKSGACYIIVSKEEGVVYKRVYNKLEQEQLLELHSDNVEYETFTIPASEIVEVWKARGYLSFELPEVQNQKSSSTVDELTTMMLQLKSEVDELKKQ